MVAKENLRVKKFGKPSTTRSAKPKIKQKTVKKVIDEDTLDQLEYLGLELKDRNVHVTAVAPGYTWSEFHDVNGARTTVSNLPSFWMLTAEDVAVTGYDAVERGVPLRVPGAWYKFLVAVSRVLPDPVGQAIMRMQEKRMVAKAQAQPSASS